ncbi:MAG: hypothetical protein A2Y56_12485 [Candidatus Aminicenantes bacterium RBG_13_63_10]|nr:MAG: hypothetical protein A2Y56_12485 [Candidatus Aminicenantes bacterium RBG_13_63_10]
MKKTCLALLCAVALFLFAAPRSEAAGPLNLYIRGGILTTSDFSFNPVIGLVGANIDLNFGALSLSPECDLLIYQFSFNPIWITPGAILNFNLGPLYVGGGVVLPLIIGSGYTLEGNLLLKLNGGLKLGNYKVQAFLITPFENLFTFTLIGLTLGFGF